MIKRHCRSQSRKSSDPATYYLIHTGGRLITLKLSLFLRIVLSLDVYEKDDDQHDLVLHP